MKDGSEESGQGNTGREEQIGREVESKGGNTWEGEEGNEGWRIDREGRKLKERM